MNKKRKRVRKIFAWFMCLAMVVTTVNLPSVTVSAQVDSGIEKSVLPSITAYADMADLVDKTKFSLWSADGGVAQKVNFGNGKTWYIAGAQNGGTELVLMCDPANPFKSNQEFDSYNIFDVQKYDVTMGTYVNYTMPANADINPNHYGGSKIREYLRSQYGENNLDIFSKAEQALMMNPDIYMEDTLNDNSIYYTSDKLYLAHGTYKDNLIVVGSNSADNLNGGINIGLWGVNGPYEKPNASKGSPYGNYDSIEEFWLRTPYVTGSMDVDATPLEMSLIASIGGNIAGGTVRTKNEVLPAFHLDLSSVVFASTATVSTDNAKLADAMTLRYDAGCHIQSELSVEGDIISIEKKNGDMGELYLYVQGKDTKDWIYSKKITKTENILASDIHEGLDLSNVKIWLETTSENVAFAKTAASKTEKHNLYVDVEKGVHICEVCGLKEAHIYASDENGTSHTCELCNAQEEHKYSHGCDLVCDDCGYERKDTLAEHEYSSDCDLTCDNCGYNRMSSTGEHDFSLYEQYGSYSHVIKCKKCKMLKPNTESVKCSSTDEDPSVCQFCGRLFTEAFTPTVKSFADKTDLVDKTKFSLWAADGGIAQKVKFGKGKIWYIAGAQNDGTELVLISDITKPWTIEGIFFHNSEKNQKYASSMGTYENYTMPANAEVYPNHYGASDIRKFLKSLYGKNKTDIFSIAEQALMKNTKVYTKDIKNAGSIYYTSDKLYLAYGDNYNTFEYCDFCEENGYYITVGANQAADLNEGIRIGIDYHNSPIGSPYGRVPYDEYDNFYLRTPRSDGKAVYVFGSENNLSWDRVNWNGKLALPVMNMDISSLLFASTAKEATANAKIEDTMIFRYDGTDKVLSSAIYEDGGIRVTKGGDNEFLYIQYKDNVGEKIYSKAITEDMTIAKADLEIDRFSNCKIWIEKKDATDNLVYAIMATKALEHHFVEDTDSGMHTCDICGLLGKHNYAVDEEEGGHKCDVCGMIEKHIFVADNNGTTHSCEVCEVQAEHRYSSDCDEICDDCEYQRNDTSGEHDFSFYEESNDFTHVIKCKKCKVLDPDSEPEDCSVSEENPSKCQLCGRVFGYYITFEANGGTELDLETILVHVGEQIGTLPTTTKVGYTFAGWYSDDTYKIKVTENTVCESEMTLYAKWTANKYNIKFDGNNATSGTMAAISGTYKDGATLPANAFKKTGYTFNGWKGNDGKTYKNKADIAPLAVATKAQEVTLTAQWKKATYTITYELNGGTNANTNPESYNVTSATITLAKPTRKGYTFGGWFSDEKFTTKVTEIKKGSTGNKTLYAKWTKNKYTIEYVLNGGTNSADNPATYTVTTPTITLAAPTRKGYKFSGWYSDDTYKTKVTEIAKGSTGKKILYAKWAKNTYTITYVLNGGTNAEANPATYNITTATITLAAPTKKGYTFKGWFTDKECTKAITEIKKGSTGSKTLYAKWSANSYNVKFNGNGATSGKMADVTGWKYGKEYELPANAFKRTGYTFKGWATTATGEVKYANKEGVKNLTAVNKKVVTLYAVWAKTKYKVTYNLDGGTNNAENPASFYYTTETITLKNPTKTGYTFGGWYSDATLKTRVKEIPKGTLKSVILYAKWTENSYSISFSANAPEETEATGTMSNITGIKYSNEITLPVNAYEVEGYIFTGWNTIADGSGITYTDEATVSSLTGKKNGVVTLYAQWVEFEEVTTESTTTEAFGETTTEEGNGEPYTLEEKTPVALSVDKFLVEIQIIEGFEASMEAEDTSKCIFTSETDEKIASIGFDLEETQEGLELESAEIIENEEETEVLYTISTDDGTGFVILDMYLLYEDGSYILITVDTKVIEDEFDIEDYIGFTVSTQVVIPE